MFLHIDSETTGLPVSGVPSDDPRHPHMASISAVLDDENGRTQAIYSTLISPQGKYRLEDFPEAFNVHGISTAAADLFGVSLERAMIHIWEMLNCCETVSAFNAHFDVKILKIACARMPNDALVTGDAIRDRLESKTGICSMESAANFLLGKKRISLANAHMDLFKVQARSGQYHGSMEDVMAHRRIFYALKAKNALLPAKPLKRDYAEPYQGSAAGGPVGSQEVPI